MTAVDGGHVRFGCLVMLLSREHKQTLSEIIICICCMLVGLRRGVSVRVAEGQYYLHPRTVFIGVSVGGISMVHKAPILAQFVDEKYSRGSWKRIKQLACNC